MLPFILAACGALGCPATTEDGPVASASKLTSLFFERCTRFMMSCCECDCCELLGVDPMFADLLML